MGILYSMYENYEIQLKADKIQYFCPEEAIKPIALALEYVDLKYEIKEYDKDAIHIVKCNNETVKGEISILKYIGRKNYMYPNKNIYNGCKLDYWLEEYVKVKFLINLCESNEISNVYFKSYVENKLKELDCIIPNKYIEDFDGMTIADFCWYSLIQFLKTKPMWLESFENKFFNINRYTSFIENILNDDLTSEYDSDDEISSLDECEKKNE